MGPDMSVSVSIVRVRVRVRVGVRVRVSVRRTTHAAAREPPALSHRS